MADGNHQTPTSRPVDRRVEVSRQRVLTSTVELLMEQGIGGVSIDHVAKRSGVAKTTIYRHWSSRTALVIDACAQMTDGDENPPDTGSLAGDVLAILLELAELLVQARWSAVLPSIVDVAERDPDIAAVHAQMQRWHAAPLTVALERGVGRGELAKNADISAISAALRGPLYYRRWFSREPLDEGFVRFVVRTVLGG